MAVKFKRAAAPNTGSSPASKANNSSSNGGASTPTASTPVANTNMGGIDLANWMNESGIDEKLKITVYHVTDSKWGIKNIFDVNGNLTTENTEVIFVGALTSGFDITGIGGDWGVSELFKG